MSWSNTSGQVIGATDGSDWGKMELDPLGSNVGLTDWWQNSQYGIPAPQGGGDMPSFETIRNGQLRRYTVDGIALLQEHFERMAELAFGGIFGFIEQQARRLAGDSSRKDLQRYVEIRNAGVRYECRRSRRLVAGNSRTIERHAQLAGQRFVGSQRLTFNFLSTIADLTENTNRQFIYLFSPEKSSNRNQSGGEI